MKQAFVIAAAMFCLFASVGNASGQQAAGVASLELVRAVRPWEFVSALGTRAGIFGDEAGNFETWVYPLKILRNFHLRFKVDGQSFDAARVARSITVRPESTSITYAWDTFSIRETLFVPVREPGALIQLEIDNAQPVEVEAVFERDFQLEWPGTMGGSDIDWVPALRAFSLTETQQRFTALIGSPSATGFHQEFATNYTASKENSLDFGVIPPGKTTRLIVIAASFQGLPPADQTYRRLSSSYSQLLADSTAYYYGYLRDHVTLELPDAALQQAYQWAQVGMLQGLVVNPFLGTGLVAGYRESGDDQRPGYAWFFGRDALWTSFALDAEGDFATTRTALDFLAKYQRADGKVPHEIAQGASFVPWFQSMPYAYASADATPLFIVAMNDYVKRSGDVDFAREKWDNLQRAYQFVVSTYDKTGFPQNAGVGHGWVEGGPLLPVRTELYQTAVVVEALRSLAELSHLLGKDEQGTSLASQYERAKIAMNNSFWIADKGRYAFGLDSKGAQADSSSVLAAVPMWFGLLDEDKANSMIDQLASPDIQTEWGMRIIPATNPKYEAAGYHSGTVWPLFTGWASVGEYRLHRPMPAYANLRSNALLTFDGSLGHVAEVLSGTYYQTLATGSPNQVWSSAMVVAPMLTGLLGLDADAIANHLSFSPHVPESWTSFAVNHIKAGPCEFNLRYGAVIDKITLHLEKTSGDRCTVDFSPALSLRTQVVDAELNGHGIPFRVESNIEDQHVTVHLNPESQSESLVIRLKNDFSLGQSFALPDLGSTNQGLRILAERWNQNRDTLELEVASASGGTYELDVWNPDQLATVDGAELLRSDQRSAKLRISLDAPLGSAVTRRTLVLHFDGKARRKSESAESRTTMKGAPNAD
jgi:glycogen debranching enzyme